MLAKGEGVPVSAEATDASTDSTFKFEAPPLAVHTNGNRHS